MIEAAKAGGVVLKKYFGRTLELTEKFDASDLQTQADRESEKAVLQILRKEFPGYNVHAEEEGETNNNHDFTFYVDPLDGTNNFVLGIPYFNVSIGLVKGREMLAGVVYLPVTNQVFYATKNGGAFLDNEKLEVNKESQVQRSTIAYAPDYKVPRTRTVAMRKKLMELGPKRNWSSWATAGDLCLLAWGKIEAVVMEDAQLYDFGGGKLIAKEAGAKVTDFAGNAEEHDLNSSFIISNGQAIHDELVNIFKS